MKTHTFIDANGVYHRRNSSPPLTADVSTDKIYRHDMQRREHQRDLLQPFVNGKPNPEFREQFPEESKDYYEH